MVVLIIGSNTKMYTKNVLALAILSLIEETFGKSDKIGPYDVVFTHPGDCAKETDQLLFDLRFSKVSRDSRVVMGRIIMKNITINDDLKLRVVMHQFTPSGWKDNFLIADMGDKGICDIMEQQLGRDELERCYRSFADTNNRTLDTFCDIPPGVYTIANPILIPEFLELKGRFQLVPQFFYGKYRLKVMLFYQDFDHQVGCLMIHFDIVPKKKTKNRNGGTTTQV